MSSNIKIENLKTCCNAGALGDVLIDRTTVFGNPFPIGSCRVNGVFHHFSRAACIQRYERYVRDGEVVVVNGKTWDGFKARIAIMELRRENVERLLCHCSPERCHGEVILKIFRENQKSIGDFMPSR
jgi:hypothetical protein